MTDPTPTTPLAEPRPARPVAEMLGPSVLVPAFVLLTTVGYVLFVRGVGAGVDSPPSKWKSLFTAVNASTLTGFQQDRRTADLTVAGQGVALGLILGGTLFSLVAGGLAVARIARLRYSDRAVVLASVALTVLVPVVGGFALLGPVDDRHPFGRAYFDAAFLAASGFGNCGLYVGGLPGGNGFRVVAVLMPLAVLGGLGVPVLLEGLDLLRGRGLSRHARTTLAWSAGVWVAVTLVLFACDYGNARFAAYANPTDADPGNRTTVAAALVDAGREAVNARSAGFPFVYASHLPAVLPAVLTVAMLVGAGAGGTAGGLAVTSLAVVSGGTADLLRRRRPVGRPFAVALVWVAAHLAAVAVVTVVLSVVESGLHLDRLAFIAASAVGNVGLSHDPIDLTPPGLTVVAVAMLLGRVGPVLALWYAVDHVPEADVATA